MSSNFSNNLETLFGKMENFISTKTVVGEPVHIGDLIMLPLVDVTFGVGAGGSDKGEAKDKKTGDMGGLGAKITPSAVIVIKGDSVQMINVKNQDAIGKLIDMAPAVLSKLNLSGLFSKNKDSKKEESIAEVNE
ncbi:MAG: sporulation protein [Defluviitaleaceae bacterium]|nr:sporulation protein [Defluviitaleaceae bacterium]